MTLYVLETSLPRQRIHDTLASGIFSQKTGFLRHHWLTARGSLTQRLQSQVKSLCVRWKIDLFYCLTMLFTNGVMVHGCSTGLPGIIPKISKEATIQNALHTLFCMAACYTAAL